MTTESLTCGKSRAKDKVLNLRGEVAIKLKFAGAESDGRNESNVCQTVSVILIGSRTVTLNRQVLKISNQAHPFGKGNEYYKFHELSSKNGTNCEIIECRPIHFVILS